MSSNLRLTFIIAAILGVISSGFAQTIDGKPVGIAVNIKSVGINFVAAHQNPTWGRYSFQIYAMNGSLSGSATYPATETNQITAQLEPGKIYYLSVNGGYTDGFHSIQAVPPPGYTIEINGHSRERIKFPDVSDPLFGDDAYWSGVTLRLVSQFNGRAGTATALAGGQINWQASLGYLSDGSPAGSVAIVDRGNVDISTLFNSTGFIYNGSSSDVKIIYNNGQDPAYVPGTIRQIIAPQACADIVVSSPTTAEVKFYHRGQIVSQSGYGSYVFGGDPFAWYIINGSSANTITIDCDTRELDGWNSVGLPVARTKRTMLTRTGSEPDFVWTTDDWHDGDNSVSRNIQERSGSNVTTSLVSPNGTPIIRGSRTSSTMAWGEETISESRGTVNPVTTTYDYYSSSDQSASYGKPRSIATTGGGWIGYEYYDYTGNFENDRAAGAVHKIHRPYKNSETNVPENLAAHTSGEVTTFQYAPDAFGRGSRPSLIETAVNGVVTARATITYTDSLSGFIGHPVLYIVTATRHDSSASGETLTSIKKYFREDANDSYYIRHDPYISYGRDTYFTLKVHSLQEPDGRKSSFVYQRGTWNIETGFSPNPSGGTFFDKSSRTCAINGSAVSGDLYTSYADYDIDDLYLIEDKSTMEVTIRDQYALVRRTESHVWHGGAWNLVSSVDYGYNYANQLTSRVSSNGGTYESAWLGELKHWEQDESGVKISYTEYDAAGRVKLMTREAGGNIPAVTTRFTYDASHRVTESLVGWGLAENLVSAFTYDDAGRLKSETPPGLGATNYSYNPSARTRTTTLPDTGTRLETFYADGRLESVTGTAVVEEHYAYDIETDGRHYTEVRSGSSTSSRLAKMWTDWLGRTKKTSEPGWTGQPDFEAENAYSATTGQLVKTTRTGYDPTRYKYSTMGQLVRYGLDIGDNDLALDSTDRITDADQSFEFVENAWWLRAETKTYPYANANAVTTSVSRTRLTGHAAGVLGENQATDAEGNTAVTTVAVNRATKTTTVTTTHPGLNNQTEIIVNGFTTSATGVDGLAFTKQYDSLLRPSSVTDPRIGDTTTTYHTGSLLLYTVSDEEAVISTCDYDTSGRKILHTDAAGKKTRYAYNLRGQLYREWGDGTYPVEYGYDPIFGDRTTLKTYRSAPTEDSETWPAVGTADTTTFTFDAATGLLSKKTDATAKFVEFTYNQRGQTYQRLWSRTYGGNRVTATYAYDDDTGELTGISYNDTTPSVSYTYTRLGQTATVSDEVSGLHTFDYNSSKPWRHSSTTLSSFYGNRVMTALYEESGVVGRARGFQLGTSTVRNADLEQAYGFTTGGRFQTLATKRESNGVSRTFSYGYLANSALVETLSISDPIDTANAFTVTRSYENNRDLLTGINTKWDVTSQTRYDYTYNALYQRETAKQSGNAFADYGNATFTRYAYDARGQLIAAPVYLVGSTLTDLSKPLPGRQHSYEYDSIGNRKWADRTGLAAQREDYTANPLNQYTHKENHSIPVQGTVDSVNTTVSVTGATETSRQGRYWAAEASVSNSTGPWRGDLTIQATKIGAGMGGSDLVRTDIRTAQLVSALQEFHYDDDGNMLSDGLWDYQWDAENRLIRMATNSVAVGAGFPNRILYFRYDYLGRRVQKRVVDGGTNAEISSRRYLYTGWNLIAEFEAPGGTSVGSLVRSYTWGLDLVGSLTASGGMGALLQIYDYSESKTLLPTYDGNGNIASLLDASTGAFEAIYEYDNSGNLLRAEGLYAKKNPFRFSTKFQDEETGIIYYGYRYYSSLIGRFINRDPIEEAGGMNLYGFSGNDSINGFDVLGLDAQDPPDTIKMPDVTYYADPPPSYTGLSGLDALAFYAVAESLEQWKSAGVSVDSQGRLEIAGTWHLAPVTAWNDYADHSEWNAGSDSPRADGGYSSLTTGSGGGSSSGNGKPRSRGERFAEGFRKGFTLKNAVIGFGIGVALTFASPAVIVTATIVGVVGLIEAGVDIANSDDPWLAGGEFAGGMTSGMVGGGAGSLSANLTRKAIIRAAESNTARTFTSNDPLVADLANKIEAAYPGHVVGVNVPIRNAAGQLVTDADILLQNAVIQVKSGGGKGLTSQLLRTEQATSLPTIGYGPTLKPSVVNGIQRAGGLVTRDEALLIEVVKP